MKKFARLLYMLNCLATRHGVSASDLAKFCGVSERTVYRDVNHIFHAGYPIYYNGGYRVLKPGSMPPGNFTFDELRVLKKVVNETIIKYSDIDLDALQSTLAKIERAISEQLASASPMRRLELRHQRRG